MQTMVIRDAEEMQQQTLNPSNRMKTLSQRKTVVVVDNARAVEWSHHTDPLHACTQSSQQTFN